MTSKEALERYYSNLQYGVGGFQTDVEELEALNIIKQDLEHYHNALQDKYDYSKCLCYDELLVRCKHLEKENQELKMQKNSTMILMKLMSLDGNIVESALILDKYRKAIEIIKEKKVNIVVFFMVETLKEYNANYHEDYKLTQEEYDLLKGVLKNEK